MNLDVDGWKEFRLTDIFIVKGGFYNKKPEHSVEGGIPFLASTETNNGRKFRPYIRFLRRNQTGKLLLHFSRKRHITSSTTFHALRLYQYRGVLPANHISDFSLIFRKVHLSM